MRQVLTNTITSPTVARFGAVFSGSTFNTGYGGQPWATPGTFSNFRVVMDTAPGAGTSITFTIQKNGVNTAVTVTISGTATAASDTSNSLSVVDGDLLTMHITVTGSPAASVTAWALEFDASTARVSGHSWGPGQMLAAGTEYNGILVSNGTNGWVSTVNETSEVIAVKGALTRLRVQQSNNTTAGGSLVYAVYLNGVRQDGTGGTVDTVLTIATGAATGSKSFTLPVVPGDVVYLEKTVSGTQTVGRSSDAGVEFTADIDGQSNYPTRITGTLNTVNNSFLNPETATAGTTTETTVNAFTRCGITPFTLTQMQAVLMDGSPGAGKSYTVSYRLNRSSPGYAPSAVIANAATAAADAVGRLPCNPDDIIGVRAAPSGTPTGRRLAVTAIQTMGAAPINIGVTPAVGLSIGF